MIKESKSDFFDVRKFISKDILSALAKQPHLLSDAFGNEISSKEQNLVTSDFLEIKLGNQMVAKLKTRDSLKESLDVMLAADIANEFRNQTQLDTFKASNLLYKDMDEILRISELDELNLEEQLKHLLKILRAHTFTERASIFGIYDGFTLEGLAGIGGNDQKNWTMDFSSLAGIAATTRKVYPSENPAKDPNFRAKDGSSALRNIVCCPLHG